MYPQMVKATFVYNAADDVWRGEESRGGNQKEKNIYTILSSNAEEGAGDVDTLTKELECDYKGVGIKCIHLLCIATHSGFVCVCVLCVGMSGYVLPRLSVCFVWVWFICALCVHVRRVGAKGVCVDFLVCAMLAECEFAIRFDTFSGHRIYI